MIPVAAITLRL